MIGDNISESKDCRYLEAMDDLREIYSYIVFTFMVPKTAEKQVNRIRKEVGSLDFFLSQYSFVDWEP